MSNSNHTDHTRYCTQQAMSHDRERFLSAMLAPQPMRPALMALIAWNLEIAKVGEITNEEMIGLIRYQWWRDALEEIYTGKSPRQHAVVLELAEAIKAYDLPKEDFLAIIAAREADLDRSPFATLEALDAYASRTGGEFLKLWLRVLGVEDGKALEAVAHVGTAWALLGGLRACHHLAHLGKVRLPSEMLEQAGMDADALLQKGFTPPVADVVRIVAERAGEHLCEARVHQAGMPASAYAPLSLAVQAEDFLRRLEHCAYNPAHPAMEKGRATRAFKLLWARWRGRY